MPDSNTGQQQAHLSRSNSGQGLFQGLPNYYASTVGVLYWAHGLDALHILLRRWNKAVQHIIDGFLFLMMVVNALMVYRLGSLVEFDVEQWLRLIFLDQNLAAGPFWLIMILNLFLFYRIFHKLTTSRGKINYKVRKSDKDKRVNMANVLHPNVSKLLDQGWIDVNKSGQLPIRPLQLMYILLRDKDIQMILARLGIPPKQLEQMLQRQIAYYTPDKSGSLSVQVEDIMLNAYIQAFRERAPYIRSTDIAFALVHADEQLQEMLYDLNVDMTKFTNVIKWINFNNELVARFNRYRSKSIYKPKGPINRSYTAAATPFLDSFSTDLTQQARAGQLALTVARDKQFEEMFRVMEGGKSIILVGESGVGRNNLIEGLANRMVAEEVPPIFQDKRLVSLSLPFLVAGATRTGEVEERLLLAIREVLRSGNIILVMEDIHNLVGVSSAGTENIDLSEVLSQEIQNHGVWVIATSTPADMTEYVERSALSGVFERVQIPEPDRNQTIQILEANVGRIESRHNVFFTYESIEHIVDLSDRYLHDQFLPAKAINLMSEAGSWAGNRDHKLISGEDIASLISRKTNIPVTQVSKQESNVLLNLEQIMHERIIGQDTAVKLVVSALRRARTELRDEGRPIANMLFLGPTGVGKTELAKTVAQTYFGQEESMVRLDMSEYQTQDSISRLLGAPGSRQGGVLTESIRRKPFALLLLDEIEKAHPDILNIFLQVMDDGRLTDAMGRTIDFTNVILVATSNAQANYIQDEVAKQTPVEKIKDVLVREKLRDQFRPEFLNRFDGVVVFKPLTSDEIFQIAGLLLHKVSQRLEAKGISLSVTPEAQRELATAGYDPQFGARPLRRVIQERVEEALANYLLKGEIGRRDQVVLHPGGNIEVKKAQKLT